MWRTIFATISQFQRRMPNSACVWVVAAYVGLNMLFEDDIDHLCLFLSYEHDVTMVTGYIHGFSRCSVFIPCRLRIHGALSLDETHTRQNHSATNKAFSFC